jgi:hypothetical protein
MPELSFNPCAPQECFSAPAQTKVYNTLLKSLARNAAIFHLLVLLVTTLMLSQKFEKTLARNATTKMTKIGIVIGFPRGRR